MFLDSPDKILSLGRFDIVSPDKSSCPGPKAHDSPDSVSSPDELSENGSFSSFASVNWTSLVTLDFELTLTSSVVWTLVASLCYV